jgi:hypothetical protein
MQIDDGVYEAKSNLLRGKYVVVDQGDHWSIDSPRCEVAFRRELHSKERAFEVCQEVEQELDRIHQEDCERDWFEVYSKERRWQDA